MRLKARRDQNEAGIVSALRQMGADVELVSMPDLPDAFVCHRGLVVAMEFKNPEASSKGSRKRKLRPGQEAFRVRWVAAGGRHARVETIDEALRAVGLEAK